MGNKQEGGGKQNKSAQSGLGSSAKNVNAGNKPGNEAAKDQGADTGPQVTNMQFNNKKYLTVDTFCHINLGTTELPECIKDLKCTKLILSSNGMLKQSK